MARRLMSVMNISTRSREKFPCGLKFGHGFNTQYTTNHLSYYNPTMNTTEVEIY